MHYSVLNRATVRVANTTDVSGRVTAKSVKHGFCAKTNLIIVQRWLVLVTASLGLYLVLPDRGLANDDEGIKPGVPNGTYVGTNGGYLVPPTPGISGQVPLASAGRETFTPNATGSGGTLRGISTFTIGSPDFSQVFNITFAGTFTVNADGSVSAILTTSQGVVLHSIAYLSPDGNTMTVIATDPGSINNGVATRSSPRRDEQ